ncbi:MAG: hypothetical protein IPP59_14370 [Betaproteobacteria bacterium]|nr:hypothetical protein [Candidatus Dechloromonas phosphorivorans]
MLIATRSADYFHDTLQDTFRLEEERNNWLSTWNMPAKLLNNQTGPKVHFWPT